MTLETRRFKFGKFTCISINDGDITTIPAAGFFHGAPPQALERALRKHHVPPGNLPVPCNCLVIDTGGHRVLVDTGSGTAFYPGLGQLFAGLEAEGIARGDIDTVFLSHGHWDHVGGSTLDSDGSPAFPNARYVIARGEWDHWTGEAAQANAEGELLRQLIFMRGKLLAVRDRIAFIEPESEVVPGIRAIATPGHTAHHMALLVTSGGEQMVCTLDTMNHPIHVENPGWSPAWDVLPEESVKSRRKLLDMAAREKMLMHCFHFPFPGLGRAAREGDAWKWTPVDKV